MDCELCPLLVESRTRIVDRALVGDERCATILLVGEAPGREEDIVGQPFVGRSGRKLKTLASEAGLTDFWMTNSVRCRPPLNRKPSKEEVDNCSPWLAQDFIDLNPRLIIAIGEVGETAVYKALALAHLDIPVRKVLHPAAVLRRPSLQARLEAEFEQAISPQQRVLNPLEYEIVPQGLGVKNDLVAIDVETNGEDFGELVSVQRAWYEDGKIVASFELIEREEDHG